MAETAARRQDNRVGVPGIELLEDVPEGKEGVGRHPSYAAVIDVGTFRQIDHGFMSVEAAERVWQAAVTEWELVSLDQDSLKTAVACSLIQASSQARDFSAVSFSVGSEYYSMEVIAHHASLQTSADAAVRVWARSYNHAEIPCRMTDILNTPQNIEYRQDAAYRYQCGFTNVKFAHDLATALMKSGRRLTNMDRRTIRAMRAIKTADAQNAANAKGLSAAMPDTNAQNELDEERVLAAPSDARTRFASMK